MHVLFVEPAFPKNQREFVRALSAVGARVTAIGEAPAKAAEAWATELLSGYAHDSREVVGNVSEFGIRQALRAAVGEIRAIELVNARHMVRA